MAAAIENNPKALTQWMAANGIHGSLGAKFLKAVEKKVGSARMIPVGVLEALRKSM